MRTVIQATTNILCTLAKKYSIFCKYVDAVSMLWQRLRLSDQHQTITFPLVLGKSLTGVSQIAKETLSAR